QYLQAVLSCPIYEGYGQTEGTASNIIQPTTCYEPGYVGVPFPTNIIKLAPVEGYKENEGEICLKGSNITSGYYKREDLNSELFDEEGFLKTGDIGCMVNGMFKIVGRKKDIFKTSLGEYIIPEKVEEALKGGYIEDLLIMCKKYSDYVVGLVVCKNKELCESDILKLITSVGLKLVEKGSIMKYEVPKKIHVLREDFSHYGEFLTPTGKKKRYSIESYFKNEISALFK
ncbi:Long-chain-fatty-acid--CoA ligase 6, partial [Astathelohania contejeani]